MNGLNIGFLGFGRMGNALADGLLNYSNIAPSSLYACARNFAKLQSACEKRSMHACSDAQEVLDACKLIIIAVKPHQVEKLFAGVEIPSSDKIFVSLAPGIPFDSLDTILKGSAHITVIPNTPVSVGKGILLADKTHSLNEEQLSMFKELFEPLASIEFLEESQLLIGCALAACGPAFAAMFMEALADGAVKEGMDRSVAYNLCARMLEGSAAMYPARGMHPAELKDEVCSPGGMTIKGVKSLENDGLRSACINALGACMKC